MVQELVTGKPPFTGNSESELLNKHLKSQPPSLEGLNRNVTTEFSQLIKRTLAKDPKARPESMAAFLEEMRGKSIFRVKPKEAGTRGEGRGSRDEERKVKTPKMSLALELPSPALPSSLAPRP